jgi:hypothetical protein
LAALELLSGRAGLAQTSADYDLSWHVIAGGGRLSASADYRVEGTAGQGIVGPSSSADFRLSSGFWFAEPAEERVNLPIILR